MKNIHYKAKAAKTFIKLFDTVIVLAIFIYIREYMVYGEIFRDISHIRFSLRHFSYLLTLSFLWNRIFTYMGMYRFRKVTRWEKQLRQVSTASFLGVAVMLLGAHMMGIKGINEAFPTAFLLTTLVVFAFQRWIVFWILKIVRSGRRNIRRIIIVGLNERSVLLSKKLSSPELGFNVLGFVDDGADHISCERMDKPCLCILDNFDQYISRHPVDDVLLTLPIRSCYDEIVRIIQICIAQGINIRLVTDLFNFSSDIRHNIDWDFLTSSINYEINTLTEFQEDLKRIIDIVLSATALIILSPVYIIVTLAILINDGSPVFFIQERIGINKQRFSMFKFRTMVRNAEKMQEKLEYLNENDGAAFKISNDPRITPVGRFLRKTSLDEIPQFLNVLLGSMSLVGPRPLPKRDVERFYRDSHHRRFTVKPGITGLWQISGRSEASFQEWMRMDLQYIDQWSQTLDFKILIKTIPVVLARKGAK